MSCCGGVNHANQASWICTGSPTVRGGGIGAIIFMTCGIIIIIVGLVLGKIAALSIVGPVLIALGLFLVFAGILIFVHYRNLFKQLVREQEEQEASGIDNMAQDSEPTGEDCDEIPPSYDEAVNEPKDNEPSAVIS